MSPATLQALRRLLFFSIEEAALMLAAGPDHPGGVSPRSWQYWERGERSIPADIVETITRLCAWRATAFESSSTQIAALRNRHGAPSDIVLVWYQTLDDWTSMDVREPLLWRPQCSVVAELAARLGARLVCFDAPGYARWLGQKKDSEIMRSKWAAAAYSSK